MCTTKKPKPPKQPPAQPPPVMDKAPEVVIGNTDDAVSSRKKIGRSQLKVTPSSTSAPKASGLGQ